MIMKKFIIVALMACMGICSYGQNYFSHRVITDEFGDSKTIEQKGRININDSTIVVKTASGITEIYKIVKPWNHGTLKEPFDIDGNYMYDEGYILENKIIFVTRYFLWHKSGDVRHHFWIFWKYDEDDNVIKTTVYYKE